MDNFIDLAQWRNTNQAAKSRLLPRKTLQKYFLSSFAFLNLNPEPEL
jgi:hypothetical protein